MTGWNQTSEGRLTLYGRRVGPKLRPAQAARIEAARAALDLTGRRDLLAEPHRLFAKDCRAVWLEIGFGGSEHLIWQARQNPDVGLVGCEAFLNGVARALAAIEREGLTNIRLHDGDARDVLDHLGDECLERVFLLYPDPWPKRRHWKRRFINAQNLGSLHRVLRPGGELRIASDIADYVAWTLIEIDRHGGFEWCANGARDWRERPADWPPTRYEQKAIKAARRPAYLSFRRLPDPA